MNKLFKIILIVICANIVSNCYASQAKDPELPVLHKSVLRANKLPFVILTKKADGTIKMISEKTPIDMETRAIAMLRKESESGTIVDGLKLVNQLLFPTHLQPTPAMKSEAFSVLDRLEKTNNRIVLFNLAHCLLYGTGVDQTEENYKRAIALLKCSQSQGYMPATILLAFHLFYKLVGKASFFSQVESLKLFLETAEEGSDFSMLFIGYQFMDHPNKEDRDANNAILYFKRVKDKRLVSAILSALYLSQSNPKMALETGIEAKTLYDTGKTTVPVSAEYIDYLQQKIARSDAAVKPTKLKNRENRSKRELAQKQFIETLENDLRYFKHQYDALKKYLMVLSEDTAFPVDLDFVPMVWLTKLIMIYKKFEGGWIKSKNLDERRLCLDAFAADFITLAENSYIGEQFVRSKSIPKILSDNLKNMVFHSNF